MTRPVLVLRHARKQNPDAAGRRTRLSPSAVLGAVVLAGTMLATSVASSPNEPVSLGHVRNVAMSNAQMSDRAEFSSYYARRLGHRMLRNHGYTKDRQWHCLRRLWHLESSWRVHADNRYSSAYGIPQAMPGRKMASAGSHWRRNARTQIRWGLRYVHGRYGYPCGAMRHKRSHGWY